MPQNQRTPWRPLGLAACTLVMGVLVACSPRHLSLLPGEGHDVKQLMLEPPLELGGSIHALRPDPESALELTVAPGRRAFAWLDRSRKKAFTAEVGGSSQALATGAWLSLEWSADGERLLVSDRTQESAQGKPVWNSTLFSLDGRSPVDMGWASQYEVVRLLPDASGLVLGQVSQIGMPISALPGTELSVKLPGGEPQHLARLNGPSHGVWSPDARHYAYLEYRDGEPIKGFDLRVLDRQSQNSALLYHIESDDLPKVMANLSWGPDQKVFLTASCQSGASASIAVIGVPISGQGATLKILPVSLNEEEKLASITLSPDKTMLSYETSKTITVTLPTEQGTARASGPRSQGVYVASLATGRIEKITPGGRLIGWLPGNREVVCATGESENTKYYRIEVGNLQEVSE